MGIKFFKRIEYTVCPACEGAGYIRQQNVKRWSRNECPTCLTKGIVPVERFKVRLEKEEDKDNE